MRKKNLKNLAQTTDPEDLDDLLDEERCQSIRTHVTKDTDGKKSTQSEKRKKKQGRVQRAAARELKYLPPSD